MSRQQFGTDALPRVDGHRPRGTPRASRRVKWRVACWVLVHVLVVAHIAHWKVAGTTLSPVEPSEAGETLELGYVNAGFLLFVVLVLATLVLGRFFCGWACHVVAYQDASAWLLGKLGLRPRPIRSRLLVLVPFYAAISMFVLPIAARLLAGHGYPELALRLTTDDLWARFPGPWIAALTFAVDGALVVWLLGAKGFCTYACPYGAVFGVAERFAPGRIRVTDACEGCGHCTAVCTSNVRVHEEVARFAMVVDPGCMKCMDCVNVCPKDALFYGFAPASGSREDASRGRRASAHDCESNGIAGSKSLELHSVSASSGSLGSHASHASHAQQPSIPLARAADPEDRAPFRQGVRHRDEVVLPPHSKEAAPHASTRTRHESSQRQRLGGGSPFSLLGKSRRQYDFTWPEEIAMALVFAGSLWVWRGLYGAIPFLLALGLSVVAALAAVALWRLVAQSDLVLQRHALRASGRFTRAGAGAFLVLGGMLALTAHGGVVRYLDGRAEEALELARAASIEASRTPARAAELAERRAQLLDAAERHLAWIGRIGLVATADLHNKQGSIRFARGDLDGAERELRAALERDPRFRSSRLLLADVLARRGDFERALDELAALLDVDPANADVAVRLEGLLRNDPSNERARSLLARMREADSSAGDSQ